MPGVSGHSDVYLILGDPVEQVLAPEIFNPVFAELGLNAVLVPVQVPPEHLLTFFKSAFLAKNIKGMWVTIPHKVPVMQALDHCSTLSRLAGAVNAIRRNADGKLEGALFDGEGFVNALHYFRIAHTGKRVLMLGSGGAAAAIAASLVLGDQAVAELALFDPTPGKAAQVTARFANKVPAHVLATNHADPAVYNLVINVNAFTLRPGLSQSYARRLRASA